MDRWREKGRGKKKRKGGWKEREKTDGWSELPGMARTR